MNDSSIPHRDDVVTAPPAWVYDLTEAQRQTLAGNLRMILCPKDALDAVIANESALKARGGGTIAGPIGVPQAVGATPEHDAQPSRVA